VFKKNIGNRPEIAQQHKLFYLQYFLFHRTILLFRQLNYFQSHESNTKFFFMKAILFSLLFVNISITSNLTAQQAPLTTTLAPGTKISWDLSLGYPFNITINSLKPDFVFSWDMGEGTTGKVTITGKALKKATKMIDYFEKGTDITMDDQTTVMFPKVLYKKMKAGGSAEIALDGVVQTIKFMKKEKMAVSVNGTGQSLDVLYAETDKNCKFWIWDNAATPLILKMELGWTLTIQSITTN